MPKLLIASTVAAAHRAFFLPFARHFRSLGWRVDGIAAGISSVLECHQAYDCVFEIDWSRNPLDWRNLGRAASNLRHIVETEGYDIVHVHTPVAAFVTRYALRSLRRFNRTRVIYTAHGFHFHRGGHPVKNALFFSLERIARGWMDCLVVINREDESAAKQRLCLPSERVVYMPGIGVDLRTFNPDSISPQKIKDVTEELRLSGDSKVFLMVAAFDPGKRHRDVIRALKLLQRKDVVLCFAGDGPTRAKMVDFVNSAGLAEQVRFLGFREDIPALLRIVTATVLPSEREGLPRSVLESLAMSVPVVGTDIRGVRDLLQEGTGILVPVGDIRRLAEALVFLADNPQEACRMGQLGRQLIQKYSLDNVLRLHEALYARVLQTPASCEQT
ncbi:MAG: glycosyltransferase family 4 protein [Candidatus Brachytrichaceae bacterium NZ_4S206]